MTVAQALAAYVVAAGLLTITPGLDTALVLRTAAVEGPKRAILAAIGIGVGCLVWGAAVALGLGAAVADVFRRGQEARESAWRDGGPDGPGG